MGQIKGQAYVASHQFIGDGAIVNAMYWNQPARRAAVMELVSYGFEVGNVHYRYA
jgi:hypothetical protein